MIFFLNLQINSEFVYFGATRCAVIRPTTIIASGITISVKDSISNERLSFRIAFKHILRAWVRIFVRIFFNVQKLDY